MARPTIHTEEVATKICSRIADGESLRKICRDPEMPSRTTVNRWLLDIDKEEFRRQYETACNVRADELFDELEEIADNKDGDVKRDRLRSDVRKWYLSKIMPKKFGEKLDITTGGEKIDLIEVKIINANQDTSQPSIPEDSPEQEQDTA